MATIKKIPELVAVIGDLVDSRGSARPATHKALKAAISQLPADALSPFAPTVGDEIQGVYASLPAAIRATHLLRLMLTHSCDIRFGIGSGEIIDVGDGIQDGSAWWRAREAIEAVEEHAANPGWSGIRTGLINESAPRSLLPTLHLIDAHLTRLKPGARETLLGLLRKEANQDTADRLKISASANTQRVRSNDLRPLAAAMRALWPTDTPA